MWHFIHIFAEIMPDFRLIDRRAQFAIFFLTDLFTVDYNFVVLASFDKNYELVIWKPNVFIVFLNIVWHFIHIFAEKMPDLTDRYKELNSQLILFTVFCSKNCTLWLWKKFSTHTSIERWDIEEYNGIENQIFRQAHVLSNIIFLVDNSLEIYRTGTSSCTASDHAHL